jgi:hypothetical protein
VSELSAVIGSWLSGSSGNSALNTLRTLSVIKVVSQNKTQMISLSTGKAAGGKAS